MALGNNGVMTADPGQGHEPPEVSAPSDADVVLADQYLRSLYATAYEALAAIVRSAPPGQVVEVGAGTGVARGLGHRWWRADVSEDASLDVVADARNLPFASRSLSALVLKDTLHHIADVDAFLDEAGRVLRPGGVVAVFDPYWGPLARAVYRHLHQEPYDDRSETWSFEASSPWSSNQALSYLMLVRDRTRLATRWPNLTVEPGVPLVGPSFLLSGGVSRRTLVSGRLLAGMLRWEQRRGPWFDVCRFFHVFALRAAGSEDGHR
jgi:SAM-dependent methyltransferase